MAKYFLTSVGDVFLYDSSENLVATSRAMMDTSIELTLSNTDVRGGKGNALQYVLYNGADLNVTLSDTQFNLNFLVQTAGATLATGSDVFTEEDVTLGGGGAGTVTGTPVAIQTATIYGWVTHGDGTDERVTFSGSNFTSSYGSSGDDVCVRYYVNDAAAKEMSIAANIVPKVLYTVIEAQLADAEDSANVVGSVQFIIPKLTLSGAFSMAMSPDAVAETPLTGRALAYRPTTGGCANVDVFGYIKRVVTSANWYDDAEALAIVNGDIALTHPDTEQLLVKAIHTDGSVSTPPTADLTFGTDSGAVATCSGAGLVTTVGAGTTYVTVYITNKAEKDAAVECVVS